MRSRNSATVSLSSIVAGLPLSAPPRSSRRKSAPRPRWMTSLSAWSGRPAKQREAMAKSDVPGAPPVSTVDSSVGQALGDYLTQTFGVVAAEVQKLRHDPIELLTRAVQPVLWLMLFGEVMARVRGVAPGNIAYLDFLAAGILAQSALF